MIYYLNLEQVVLVHNSFIKHFSGKPGIRDIDVLLAAVEHPRASLFYQDVNLSLYDKASAYLYHIAQGKPFIQGNSRTAFGCCLMFIQANWIEIKVDYSTLEHMAKEAAIGKIDKSQISKMLELGN